MNDYPEDSLNLNIDTADHSMISIYLKDIGQYKLLTAQEELELSKKILAGDDAAKGKMIRANLRLVVKIAKNYAHFGLPLMDLIAEGNMGLIKAVERFDPSKGGKLSTYASWWIKQYIKRALSNQTKTIRLPIHLVERLTKIRRAIQAFQEKHDREPTNEEIGLELGVSTNKIAHLRQISVTPASLEAPSSPDHEESLGQIVPDDKQMSPSEKFSRKSLKQDLYHLLDQLDPREARILKMRFGIGYEQPLTLDETGLQLDITRERVRQIQDEAIVHLRRLLKDQEAIFSQEEIAVNQTTQNRLIILKEFAQQLEKIKKH